MQRQDGHWVFELEADATMPASLQHYLGTVEPDLQRRLATYLRESQGADGGWSLIHGGAFDLSASVIAYFALKAAGDQADAPHMERASAVILARGGAHRPPTSPPAASGFWRSSATNKTIMSSLRRSPSCGANRRVWALARFRYLTTGNSCRIQFGI